MRTITAQQGQTVFDIAMQYMGSVMGVFDILELNVFLRLDMAIPAGTVVFVPNTVINARITDYYARNGIVPVSGLGEEVDLNPEDMINIVQKLDFQIESGTHNFDGVRLWNLKNMLTVQVNYALGPQIPNYVPGIDDVLFSLEQSLDGVNYVPVQSTTISLSPTLQSYIYNLLDLQTNFVRGHVIVNGVAVGGSINEIIFRI